MAAKEEPNNRRLAQELEKASDAMQRILHAGITTEAVCILVAHKTKLSTKTINKVITEMASLKKKYCTPENM